MKCPSPHNQVRQVGFYVEIFDQASVAVVLIIVLRKRKSGKKEDKAGKPFVVSLAAQHAGAAIEVLEGGILIGRDPTACRVVYADETPGVSGKHARVEWDKNSSEFIVTDIGSSYGTFLSNNTKFEVNVPKRLKAGESIYLGEAANVIRFEVR